MTEELNNGISRFSLNALLQSKITLSSTHLCYTRYIKTLPVQYFLCCEHLHPSIGFS